MYATVQDFIREFGETESIALTDEARTGELGEARLIGALQDASAEINRYLSPRFSLPLVGTSPALIRICCDLARYYLTGGIANETSVIATRFRDAKRDLVDIRDGKIGLGLDAQEQIITGQKRVKAILPCKPVFSRGSLGDY